MFMFNHIIACFRVPKQIVTNHGSHFQNTMMMKQSNSLRFKKEHLSPYYPKENEKLEADNKSLKVMLQKNVDKN